MAGNGKGGTGKRWTTAELIAEANAMVTKIVEEIGAEPEVPEGFDGFQQVAAFVTQSVTQTASEWGDLKLTFKVAAQQKWAALRATDYPGQRLAVVVFAAPQVTADDDE